MKKHFITAALVTCVVSLFGSVHDRWTISANSSAIRMNVPDVTLPHYDHIEMSGKMMSAVLYWDVNADTVFGVNRRLVFPMLRTIPNDTHASLIIDNDIDYQSMIRINGKSFRFRTDTVIIDGYMRVVSTCTPHAGSPLSARLERSIFPSVDKAVLSERYRLTNTGSEPLNIMIPSVRQQYTTDPAKGVDGAYIVVTTSSGDGAYTLPPGQNVDFSLSVQAYAEAKGQEQCISPAEEQNGRDNFIRYIDNNLVLETPDSVINTEFRFAKIRGAESIYKTKGGYMHGPGGEAYYAAIWANDQAEYINPFFPFLGYEIGNASALNSFRHFARFMNDDFKAIPSSIIAEGDDIWNGAGDRGDAAMIAYGAARYALARGNRDEAEELWPLIEWCLEYNRRKLNDDGVVISDHDELEGRFPAGKANLCTSTLYYDALISAANLGRDLGKGSRQTAIYLKQAKELRKAIERYFGANVAGYDTYRYYDGNDILRSWICIPLTAGINDRAEETVKALFSPEMYTEDGVLTCQGYPVFWDRATLYTLRGALAAGYPDSVIPKLSAFSRRRLLGQHVPYPVEAWPEGSQRHLSAESGLYCRVITEGLFGIRPIGLNSFELTPNLPSDWSYARLRHIKAFGKDFDIDVVRRPNNSLAITVTDTDGHISKFTVKCGNTVSVRL